LHTLRIAEFDLRIYVTGDIDRLGLTNSSTVHPPELF
jgi:hypothetical protein